MQRNNRQKKIYEIIHTLTHRLLCYIDGYILHKHTTTYATTNAIFLYCYCYFLTLEYKKKTMESED